MNGVNMTDDETIAVVAQAIEEAAAMEKDEGKKNDGGKLPWGILPVGPLEEVLRAAKHGVDKYGRDNWQHLPEARERYLDAAYRHIAARRKGEMRDEESGASHLAHAVCSLLFVLWFDLKEGKPMDFWEKRCHEMEAIARRLRLENVKLKRLKGVPVEEESTSNGAAQR